MSELKKVDFTALLERVKVKMDSNKELYDKIAANEAKHLEYIRKTEIEKETSFSGLPRIDGIDTPIEPKNDQQKSVIRRLKNVNLKKNFRLPYIFGPSGTGKSYISIRYAYKLIYEGVTNVRFVSLSEFLIKYRDYDDSMKIGYVNNPYVLIMDDFCSHNITQLTVELLHACIDHRLRNKKPTLITSNVSADSVSKLLYSSGARSGVSKTMCDAIEDRLFELCTFNKLSFGSIREEIAMKTIEEVCNEN